MLDNGKSAGQIRAIAGCTFAEAQAASYMATGAANGWTLAEFMEKTRIASAAARGFAYRFGITFPDFNPFAVPVNLAWHKVKLQGWELRNGDDVIGHCKRVVGSGKYSGSACGICEEAWSAQFVMTRIAEQLDALSPNLFGGRVVQTSICDEGGNLESVVFPDYGEAVARCRAAFQPALAA